MAAWLTRRAKSSAVDLPTLTLPKTASAFVRLNSPDDSRRKGSPCSCVRRLVMPLRRHCEDTSETQFRRYAPWWALFLLRLFRHCVLFSAIPMAATKTAGQEQLGLLSEFRIVGKCTARA